MLEDNIDKVLKGMGCKGEKWINLVHNMLQRQTLQTKVGYVQVPQDGEFLYYMRLSAFQKGVPEATCYDRNFWIRM